MADDDLNTEPKKKSKLMTILMILGGVLTLVGIVIGTLYAMDMIRLPKSESGSTKSAEAVDTDRGKDAIYYPLLPFTVNFRNDNNTRFMQISISALVRSEEIVKALEKHQPVIRNNLLLLFTGQVPSDLRTREGKEELREIVLKETQSILEKQTGGKGVEQIFFTSFVMQ